MTEPGPLRGDCDRCAALCCLALALDRGASFAIDKPAGLPCPHLGPRGRCGIHAARAEAGFSGCIGYDCAGAGQHVTERLFGGQSWQDDPALAAPMMAAFAQARRWHEELALALSALALPLPPDLRAEAEALRDDLHARATAAPPPPEAEAAAASARLRAFLPRLRPYAARG